MELLLLLLLLAFSVLLVFMEKSLRFGSMVVFFRYSPIDIHNVHLPPTMLEFNGIAQQEWTRKEAAEVLFKNAGLLTACC